MQGKPGGENKSEESVREQVASSGKHEGQYRTKRTEQMDYGSRWTRGNVLGKKGSLLYL